MLSPRWKNALRVALRSLIAGRWNTVAAVLVLSVVVAAGHSIAAIWSSTVERRLSWRNADETVAVTVHGDPEETERDAGSQNRADQYLSSIEVALLRQSSASLSWIGVASPKRVIVGGSDEARLLFAAEFGPGALEALGASPTVGRGFHDTDYGTAGAGADALVPILLRTDLASSLFGSAEDAVGKRLDLGPQRAEVIGVMPRDFVFPSERFTVWQPAAPRSGDLITKMPVAARIAPGASPRVAAAEAGAILRRAGHRTARERVVLTPFTEELTAGIRPPLEILRAGAVLLLIVAAASVANLRLSQVLGEQRASGIRRAVGATAGDEIAAAAVRVVLLAGVVTSGAVVASTWLLPLLRRYGSSLLFADDWTADGSAVGRAFLAGAIAVALAEAPSLFEILRERSGAITSGARGAHDRRPFLLPLLAAGTAASTVVLVATAVLSGSAWLLLAGRGGYSDTELGVLTVDFGGRSAEAAPAGAERRRVLDALVGRIEALPAVRMAGYANALPDSPQGTRAFVGGAPGAGGVPVAIRHVSAGFLGVLQIPVLRGRGLTAADWNSGDIVGVVSRGLADRTVGDRLDRLVQAGSEQVRVVGVVADVLTFPARDDGFTLYRPYTAPPDPFAGLVNLGASTVEVVARFRGDVTAERLAMLASLPKTVDPSLRVLGLQSVRARRIGMLGASALVSAALVVFAAAGVLLTVVGVVGHIADTAARQAHPNAIRLALGAKPALVVWQVARRAGMAAGAGIGAGVLLGWLLARAIGSRILWVETGDPFLYLGPASFVALLVAAGGLYAGLRAARSSPWALLRSL